MAMRVLGMLLLLLASSMAQEPLGCGGFVSLANHGNGLDVTAVQVQLLTPGGAEVETTECAPNGYFFLPLYAPATTLVVRPRGPDGWSFEPSEVQVQVVDGECNGNEELSFALAGLQVAGRVSLPAGCRAEDVDDEVVRGMELLVEQDGVLVASQALDSLAYVMEALPAGSYAMGLSHAVLPVASQTPLEVGWSGVAQQPPALLAYVLHVTVRLSASLPASHARLSLRTPDAVLREARADADGVASLHVACGLHTVTLMDLTAEPLVVDVRHPLTSVVVDVVAMPVAGQLLGPDARSIPGHVTTTQLDATHSLDAPQGSFTLNLAVTEAVVEAEADGFRFVPRVIDPLAHVGDGLVLQASHRLLCGRLEGEGAADRILLLEGDVGDASASLLEHRRQWLASDPPSTTTVTDAEGRFCLWAGVEGRVRVQASSEEQRSAVVWAPGVREVAHDADPPVFRLAAFTLSGSVQAHAASCQAMHVLLDGNAKAQVTPECRFSFAAVLPGTHTLELLAPAFCWKEDVLEVTVTDADLATALFEQSGFRMQLEAPHAMHLTARLESGAVQELDVPKGKSSACLAAAGTYKIEATHEHRLAEPITFSTSSPSVVAPRVSHYRIHGIVTLPSASQTLQLLVAEEGSEEVAQAEARRDGSSLVWTSWAAAGSKVQVRCLSEELVCEPAVLLHSVSASTLETAPLVAHVGHFVEGVVEPRMQGVEVVVRDAQGQVLLSALSDAQGHYRAGPLRQQSGLAASAHLDGFHFSSSSEGFRAVRLGDVAVQVADEAGEGLEQVLLSLTGDASFRTNTQTGADGSVAITELFPGSYYLKPMLKEYVFEPTSLTVDVAEGKATAARFTARRVAFSAFGSVRSLAGSPEKVVTVVAKSSNGLQEEAQTDAEGNFRIRGLKPGTAYEVQAGKQARVNHVSPPSYSIQVQDHDTRDLHFTALRPASKLYISGTVASSYLNTLTVILEKASGEEVSSYGMGVSSHFVFTNVVKGEYRVRLRTTLDPLSYDFELQEMLLDFDTSSKAHVDLSFEAVPKAITAELSNSSFFLLLVLTAVVLVLYYRKHTFAFAKEMYYGKKVKSVASADDYLPAHLTSKKRGNKKNK